KDKMVWGTDEVLQFYDFATRKSRVWNRKECGIAGPVKKTVWNQEATAAYLCTNNATEYTIFKLNGRTCTAVFNGKVQPGDSQTVIDTLFSSVRVLSDR